MVVTLGQQYNVGEKPAILLYTYIVIFTLLCKNLVIKKKYNGGFPPILYCSPCVTTLGSLYNQWSHLTRLTY